MSSKTYYVLLMFSPCSSVFCSNDGLKSLTTPSFRFIKGIQNWAEENPFKPNPYHAYVPVNCLLTVLSVYWYNAIFSAHSGLLFCDCSDIKESKDLWVRMIKQQDLSDKEIGRSGH